MSNGYEAPEMRGGFVFRWKGEYDLEKGPVRRMVEFTYDRLQNRDPDLTVDQWVERIMVDEEGDQAAFEMVLDAYRELRTGQPFDPDRHDVPELVSMGTGEANEALLEQENEAVVVSSLEDVPAQEERRAVGNEEVKEILEKVKEILEKECVG